MTSSSTSFKSSTISSSKNSSSTLSNSNARNSRRRASSSGESFSGDDSNDTITEPYHLPGEIGREGEFTDKVRISIQFFL